MTDISVEKQRDTGMAALVGGMIIDGNGGAPIDDGVILIDGKRIAAVGDRSIPIPPWAKQIQVSGKFIIPGFIDHGALVCPFDIERYEGRYEELALEASQVALKSGITTFFDLIGPRDALIRTRAAINEGKAIGSRIYLCGNWIGCGGPFTADSRPSPLPELTPQKNRINALLECNVGPVLTSMSPVQVRDEIRKYIGTGVDFLHVLVNVHRYGAQQFFQFSSRVLRAIVEEAHRADLVVGGNCMYSEEGVWTAVDAGVDLPALAHMSTRLSTETLELLAKRQIAWNIRPSTHKELEWYRQRMQNQNDEWSRVNRDMAEAKPLNELALLRAGVPVTLGIGSWLLNAEQLKNPLLVDHSPSAESGQIGKAHFAALLGAQDLGMSPMDALLALTRNVARARRIDKDLGTLEPGKYADILVLDRSPLENAENYQSISLVIKEGKVVDREALPTQRLQTAPSVVTL